MKGGFSVGRAAFWAATWAVGVAVGVASGAWLTVVGGAGTPGADALNATDDLLVLPAIAAAVVFAAHFFGQMLVAGVRSRAASRHGGDDDH